MKKYLIAFMEKYYTFNCTGDSLWLIQYLRQKYRKLTHLSNDNGQLVSSKNIEKILYTNNTKKYFVTYNNLIKNPRSKLRGIEDFSLKSLRMRGNKSPTPPVFRSKLRGIKPEEI
jgi:hypothetical protein